MDELSFTLNGEAVTVRGLPATTTLLDWLRASGRTGTKEGCAEGDCGACSVALVERRSDGAPTFRAVNGCITLLPMVAGREVVTVEGLCDARRGEALHPVQQAMVECYGSQCGYCTPGFVVSLFEGYYRDDLGPDAADAIDAQLEGNLCRCTGYRPIRDAARRALAERTDRGDDRFRTRLTAPVEALAGLDYEANGQIFVRPTSLAALLDALAASPDARLVAGATDLGLAVTLRHERFARLVSVEAVPELSEIQVSEDRVRVGAAVTLTRMQEALAGRFPALDDMLRVFASRQIRNRATIGGNVANASPIGDLPPVLLALDAEVVIAGPAGERTVPIDRFFLAYRRTALEPGEVLKEVVIPCGASAAGLERSSAAYKVSKRREMDISIVAAAFVVDRDGEGIVRHARLAYGGIAATPIRASDAEGALLGRRLDEEAAAALAPLLDAAFTPITDHRGSERYRRLLIRTLFERFVHEHPLAGAPA